MNCKLTLKLTKPIPNTKYTHLEICLTHTHGGVSYLDYKPYDAGYYLHFRPIELIDNGSYKTVSFSLFEKPELSFKTNIYEKYRKSKKDEMALWDLILDNKDKIFEAWETLIPTNVMKVLQNVFKDYINKDAS